ncbi:protein MIS12 homolog isoform X1 [Syzygium oleosum]|uniref:protein MIS12 homolog isoform X1 n=1 Tax=Syzygium oleosum TaxID=219896 RepID=UPI0024B8FCFC|nr:protein MIS12 homolog isoform X1 [Syzygium oleosum]
MEGSESEAMFESLNLKPQLFINEVVNSVDDLLDEALLFYHQRASNVLGTEGSDRARDLGKGVAYLHNMIQSVLDKHLGMWEKYCLRHCFSVPEGFSFPKDNTSAGDIPSSQDPIVDLELQEQLDSLRNRLVSVIKESAELNQELEVLERHAVSTDQFSKVVTEALESTSQSSLHDTFQEMMRTADELRCKIAKFKTRRMEETENSKKMRLDHQKNNFSMVDRSTGLCGAKLEDLQHFLTDLKKM